MCLGLGSLPQHVEGTGTAPCSCRAHLQAAILLNLLQSCYMRLWTRVAPPHPEPIPQVHGWGRALPAAPSVAHP